MNHLNRFYSGGAGFVLAVLATLLAGSQVARAETTRLICHMDDPGIIEAEPTTIELNEAQSSVTVHFSANHYTTGTGDEHSGHSIGPLPATFSAETITFTDPHPQGIFSSFTINRLTGAFVNIESNWKWTCQVGKAKF